MDTEPMVAFIPFLSVFSFSELKADKKADWNPYDKIKVGMFANSFVLKFIFDILKSLTSSPLPWHSLMNRNNANRTTPRSKMNPAILSSDICFFTINTSNATPSTICKNSLEDQNLPLNILRLFINELAASPKILKKTIGNPQLAIVIMIHIKNMLFPAKSIIADLGICSFARHVLSFQN